MNVPFWDGWPHVLETQQFSADILEDIVRHARAFEEALATRKKLPRKSKRQRHVVKLLFYEPSTRTEDSSWLAAHNLGCRIRDVSHPNAFSSAVKGESFTDAVAAFTRVGGLGYMRAADCVVIRHSQDDAAKRAAAIVDTARRDEAHHDPLPVINAGDGALQHPTQAFVDLYTIHRERKNEGHPLDDLVVLLSGDLKRGRTINSLLHLLGKFGTRHSIKVIFSTHDQLGPKQDILAYLSKHGIEYQFIVDFKKAIPLANVIYLTRIQRERNDGQDSSFVDRELRERYVFRKDYLELLKAGAFVMHPLPINRDPKDPPAEIDDALTFLALSGDPRLAWFRQSARGNPVRTALFDLIFAGCDQRRKKSS